jgi:hypothetical protein
LINLQLLDGGTGLAKMVLLTAGVKLSQGHKVLAQQHVEELL